MRQLYVISRPHRLAGMFPSSLIFMNKGPAAPPLRSNAGAVAASAQLQPGSEHALMSSGCHVHEK